MNFECQICGGHLRFDPKRDLKICTGECKGVFLA